MKHLKYKECPNQICYYFEKGENQYNHILQSEKNEINKNMTSLELKYPKHEIIKIIS